MNQSQTVWLIARSDAQLEQLREDALRVLETNPYHPDAKANVRAITTILRGRRERADHPKP